MNEYFCVLETDFGIFRIFDNGNEVTGIVRLDSKDNVGISEHPSSLTRYAALALSDYFRGVRKSFEDIPIVFHGTQFREKVWQALIRIPYGKVRTYGDIAKSVGCSGGSRAVGQAVHHNPLLILVPCHRIVAHSHLGGFGSGMDLKIKLLKLEGII